MKFLQYVRILTGLISFDTIISSMLISAIVTNGKRVLWHLVMKPGGVAEEIKKFRPEKWMPKCWGRCTQTYMYTNMWEKSSRLQPCALGGGKMISLKSTQSSRTKKSPIVSHHKQSRKSCDTPQKTVFYITVATTCFAVQGPKHFSLFLYDLQFVRKLEEFRGENGRFVTLSFCEKKSFFLNCCCNHTINCTEKN